MELIAAISYDNYYSHLCDLLVNWHNNNALHIVSFVLHWGINIQIMI
jgi:hypothetical protein